MARQCQVPLFCILQHRIPCNFLFTALTTLIFVAISWNHRMVEWFVLEGTCHGHRCLPLDQVAQSLIQPCVEYVRGIQSIQNFSGKPVPVPPPPHSKEFPPNILSKPPIFQFKAILPYLVLVKKSLFISLIDSLQVLEGAPRSPQSLLFFSLNNLISLILSSSDRFSSPLIIFMASSGLTLTGGF